MGLLGSVSQPNPVSTSFEDSSTYVTALRNRAGAFASGSIILDSAAVQSASADCPTPSKCLMSLGFVKWVNHKPYLACAQMADPGNHRGINLGEQHDVDNSCG